MTKKQLLEELKVIKEELLTELQETQGNSSTILIASEKARFIEAIKEIIRRAELKT